MTVQVVFFRASSLSKSKAAAVVGEIVAREAVTIPGTTSRAVATGEAVIIFNGEASAVLAAWGSTPDAVATAETSSTTAGYPVPAGAVSHPIVAASGSKINVKAVP